MVGTSWLQGTSRDGEMHDHVHNPILPRVRTLSDGKWRATDTMAIRRQIPAIQATAPGAKSPVQLGGSRPRPSKASQLKFSSANRSSPGSRVFCMVIGTQNALAIGSVIEHEYMAEHGPSEFQYVLRLMEACTCSS